MRGIKALFIDFDNTLHDFSHASGNAMEAVYGKIIHKYHIDENRLKTDYVMLLKKTEENAFVDGRTSFEYRAERFRSLLDNFAIVDEDLVKELVQVYGKNLEKHMHLFDNVYSLLEVAKESYDLFLVTEGPSDAQRHNLEVLGIKDFFKRIFISGELRKIKSDGSLFLHAVNESGYSVDEILVIGDSYKRDVIGAFKAGLRTIWIDEKGDIPDNYETKPYLRINKFEDLEKIFTVI